MAIIHNGYIDKRFHDSFKGTDLNDVDIATTKMYKGVVPMWQQLGFNIESSNIPTSKFYWKNIIPKNYQLRHAHIFGISVQTSYADDPVGVSTGLKRKPYKKIIINDEVSQDWRGADPNFPYYAKPAPYYPPIPRISRFGFFSDNVDETVFYGSKQTWDGDDDFAPITNLEESNPNLLLNIDYGHSLTDDLEDTMGLNKIIYNQDFTITFNDDNRIVGDEIIVPDTLETNIEKQAF